MADVLTTFPQRREFDRARRALDDLSVSYHVVSPDPGCARVGTPSLAMDAETRLRLIERDDSFVCSGWVDYRAAGISVPLNPPPEFAEDIFGTSAIMVLAPCVADSIRIRLVAHLSGDLGEVFPYLNAEMNTASYDPDGSAFTFMDGYRMISLYPRRITVAKADDIVDAWRILESIRCHANAVWGRRAELQPCYERRKRPPALEIYRRLPRTNCGLCSEPTCMAFAVKVWQGQRLPGDCRPVFDGDQVHLRDALEEICLGLGVVS